MNDKGKKIITGEVELQSVISQMFSRFKWVDIKNVYT